MQKVAIKPFRTFATLKPSKRALQFSTVYNEEQLKTALAQMLKRQEGKRKYLILEPKFDGVRCVLSKEGDKFGFRSDEEKQFPLPRLKVVLDAIKSSRLPSSCVLDGEMYMKGSEGRSSQGHQAVAGFLHSHEAPTREQLDALEYVFWDILYLNGKDISSLPLHERKELLPKIKKPHFRTGPLVESLPDYKSVQSKCKEIMSAEGVMVKDPYMTYWEPTRTWKIKRVYDVDVKVGQVIPKTAGTVYLTYIRGQDEPIGFTYKTAYLKDIKKGDVIRVMVSKIYATKSPSGELIFHWWSPTPRNPGLSDYVDKQLVSGGVEKRHPDKSVDDVKYVRAIWETTGKLIKPGKVEAVE